MMYKLIASDMDGTLLNEKLEISERTAEAVRAAVNKSIRFVIASGRPFAGVKRYMDMLGIDGTVITYNGAKVVEYRAGSRGADAENAQGDVASNEAENEKMGTVETLAEISMLGSDVELILELGDMLDTTVCIWADENLYVNRINELVEKYCEHSGSTPTVMPSAAEVAQMNIAKILWYDDPAVIEDWMNSGMFEPLKETIFMRSNPEFLEFMNEKADKGSALRIIAEHYGIPRSEVLAFGDGENDITMIDYAGCGVVMDNASDEIKKHANAITGRNTEDGVAKYIEGLLRNEKCTLTEDRSTRPFFLE